MARPSSAGPFGRPDGISYNYGAGPQPVQRLHSDASPEWKQRKGGGAADASKPGVVQSTMVQSLGDAFGIGWSGGGSS